jgi:hypothetical protein
MGFAWKRLSFRWGRTELSEVEMSATYSVTIELNELDLALLYHTVTSDQGEYRTVFWQQSGRKERHYVSHSWLESRVFGAIAQNQPEWLPVIERAQKRLSLHGK